MIACHNCVHYEVCKAIIGEKELFINDIACRFSSECGAYKNAETYVEIVRCKDCKHCIETSASSTKIACTKGVNWRAVEQNHFCSYGERKDNAR